MTTTGATTAVRAPRGGVGRQSGLVGVLAMVAVGSGLVLDLTVATRYGVSEQTDAFVVSARIPLGLMAILIAAANQALVPNFSRWLVQLPAARTSQLVSTVMVVAMGAGLVVAVVLGAVATPLVSLVAPGLSPAQAALAGDLARVMVLVVPLTAGSEVLRAYLNASSSFAVPAVMTVMLNVVAIGVIVGVGGDIAVVPVAYVAGSAVQLVVMFGVARRHGLRFRPTAGLRDPDIRATGRLSARPLVASGLNPLARVVEVFFASMLPTGSVTVLHYGNRLISAIGGTVLFRSVMVTLLPRMSRAEARGDRAEADRLYVLGVRVMLALALPLTAAMVALSGPVTQLLFARGRFDTQSATLLGLVLVVYATSLVGSGVQRAMLAPFMARLSPGTPLRNTVYGVGANVVLLVPLVALARGDHRGVLAVAAAYSLSQYVHVAHAWWCLRRDVGVDLRPLARPTLVSAAASGLAMVVMVAMVGRLGAPADAARSALLADVTATASVGALIVVAGYVVGGELRPADLRRRLGRRVPPPSRDRARRSS